MNTADLKPRTIGYMAVAVLVVGGLCILTHQQPLLQIGYIGAGVLLALLAVSRYLRLRLTRSSEAGKR